MREFSIINLALYLSFVRLNNRKEREEKEAQQHQQLQQQQSIIGGQLRMRHRWERNWFLTDEAMSLTSFQVLPVLPHTHCKIKWERVWERQHVVVTLSRMKVTPRNRRLAFVFVSLHWLWQLALQTMRKAKPNKSHEKSNRNALLLLSHSVLFSLCIVIAVALRLSAASLCEFSVWLLTTSTTVRCLRVLLTWAQSSSPDYQQQRQRHQELYP